MPHDVQRDAADRDPVDPRDLLYQYKPAKAPARLPHQVDLRPICPMVHEQGNPGTCTAHAIAGAFQFEQRRLELPDFSPSRLFIYYNERAMQHASGHDHGPNLRAGLKAVVKYGVCPEKLWPYSQKPSEIATKPPAEAYRVAKKNKIVAYHRIEMGQRSAGAFLQLMKCCLAEGCPFLFAFHYHESFENPGVGKNGQMPAPKPHDKFKHWHAVMAVGYNDPSKHVVVRNSWGWSWGDKGYFFMPYDLIVDPERTADFWTIRGVTSSAELED